MNDKKSLIVPSSIMAASVLLSVIIFSTVWKSARTADQTITVTGSAKEFIISNLGILNGSMSATESDAKTAYNKLKSMMPILQSYLNNKGFTKEKVEFFAIENYAVYELNSQGFQTQNISHYVYTQRFKIESGDVQLIKNLALTISELIEQGVQINTPQPEYLFTNIDEIKIAVQAKAAENAMLRALKIAEATDRNLGPLRSARMGVIQITPRNSTMVSDYGFNDTSSIEKEITAVVSASFSIE
ncbi:MAG: SIMPL domain-containing protein [Ignavibacteriae bacterium HGW-Ignavibacteriae-2]|jgi:hypothetical protein|nr:SIMPL domain-containing protein [Bacteroidota bacterium]PKL88520.1 MAG: SIMPL domain-containing protein [Ignavibacteriae bacterium HGW-Ignavibacteriae-2]